MIAFNKRIILVPSSWIRGRTELVLSLTGEWSLMWSILPLL